MGLTPHGKSQSNPEEGVCVHMCVCTWVQEDEGKSQREITSLLAGVPPCWGCATNQDNGKCCERCLGTTESSPATTQGRLSGLPAWQPSKQKRLMAGAQNWTEKGG